MNVMPVTAEQMNEVLDLLLGNGEMRKQLRQRLAETDLPDGIDPTMKEAIVKLRSFDLASLPDGTRKLAQDAIVKAMGELASFSTLAPQQGPAQSLSDNEAKFASALKMPNAQGGSGFLQMPAR
jgi:hypothetical protein